MKKIREVIFWIFGTCLGIGIVVSSLEKKKGWIEGHKPKGTYEKYVKRPLDIGLSLFGCISLSPVMLFIAVCAYLKQGPPVLFLQERPGLAGKPFKLLKFRTMRNPKDGAAEPEKDAERLTQFGRRLRSTSLDELPELFNIIKGDMSIVGPRPLLTQYRNRYNSHQARRHEVRPGFTGLAQVHGRNSISWERKFDWDIKYVDHITFWGDCKIIFQTIKTVILREGITGTSGEATMAEFMGNG